MGGWRFCRRQANRKGSGVFAKVASAVKTKDEAQAIVTTEVQAAQAVWDALPAEEKTDDNPRPADITWEE